MARGPLFFENLRAAKRGEDILNGYEFPLYSDAQVVDESQVGPYQFINTVARINHYGTHAVAPVVVLRVDMHVDFERPRMDKTNAGTYRGGSLSDEIAALAALATEARFEAGPTTREFTPLDVRGRPIAVYGHRIPALGRGAFGPTLPWAGGIHSLEDLDWLSYSYEADIGDQIALI
jgi:hypothetical protein